MISWNRLAAVLTAATATVHLGLAVSGFSTAPFAALILVGMAAWCLVCAKHLWTSGSARTCLIAAGGGLAMIALHFTIMAAPAADGPVMAGHHHHHAASAAAPALSAMDIAMVSGVVAEAVLIGLVAATFVRKGRVSRG